MHIPFLSARASRAAADALRADEAKASRIGPLIAFQSQGRAVWTPRDYAALAREGFAKNAIVYRCVRMIAEATASVPWPLYEGEAELTEHPLLALLGKRGTHSSCFSTWTPAFAGEAEESHVNQDKGTEMTQELKAAPEVKSAEATEAFGDFMHAFEAFKDANDERLATIERKMTADVVTEDKVNRINRALDEQKRVMDQLVLKGRRPALGGVAVSSAAALEHKAAFEAYVRGGAEDGLRSFEQKALAVSTNSGADGGYLVPDETEREIGRRLASISPIRGISGVRQISGNVYKKPFAITGAATGWVAEADSRAQTNTPTLAELQFPAMELYAMPAATGTLLDDSAVNIDEWIAAEVEQAFATQEGTAFVNGDGDGTPTGFLHYTKAAEASWVWTKIGYVKTGVSAAFAADGGGYDNLVDLVYTLKSGYRQNAHFVMNRKTQGAVRKLKDENDNYIWAPAATLGTPASLMGFPIAESEDMPDIGADAYAIAFGDFLHGYLIVDRIGVRVLRDPYSAKPYVLFYTTKRVGGGVQDFDAIKLLKFGTA